MIKTAIFAVVASASIAASAQAKDWYMVDNQNANCVPMAQIFRGLVTTPYQFERYLRSSGELDSIKIKKDQIEEEVVTIAGALQGDTMQGWMFFENPADCRIVLKVLEQDSYVVDPNNLN